ncbi:hypothetical protein G6O69_26250 [Pseudenhygromyxa sp. WMMC2535]|uniref:hypothetical protein n=1 Tax=Pseudenhygromyxa sp. WMMC2535 TaxID=2712867 RepID=UPI001553969C|nr:hypothetical protein [Pseudenhygromyxa sp. WMMC2535]NVB41367.1 hypothetical protein [Pseudenhygromyxa sp. WMMC2535]
MAFAPELVSAGAELGASATGWRAFLELDFILDAIVILVIAVALAAVIAYHPVARARATTLEALEQPKTLLTYALVGALIAIIVEIQPTMALVVFGIGGLMRFRTNVGEAKDTGRVILVAVIGLCCGLELYVVAFLATLLAWALIFALERHRFGRVTIQGLDPTILDAASEAHAEALRELGCEVLGEDRRVRKGSAALTYKAPRGLDRARLADRLAQLPEDLRGTLAWEP